MIMEKIIFNHPQRMPGLNLIIYCSQALLVLLWAELSSMALAQLLCEANKTKPAVEILCKNKKKILKNLLSFVQVCLEIFSKWIIKVERERSYHSRNAWGNENYLVMVCSHVSHASYRRSLNSTLFAAFLHSLDSLQDKYRSLFSSISFFLTSNSRTSSISWLRINLIVL